MGGSVVFRMPVCQDFSCVYGCLSLNSLHDMKTGFAASRSAFIGTLQVPEQMTGQGKPRVSIAKQFGQWFFVLCLTAVFYGVISHFGVQTVVVVGRSMNPTLEDTRFYFLNRLVYLIRSPRPSEIVVLRDPQEGGISVKRIIAGSGDLVSIRNGLVFVNNRPLLEPYLAKGTPTYPYCSLREQTFTMHSGEFFVLGDNRLNSADSRTYGPISRGDILGQIIR